MPERTTIVVPCFNEAHRLPQEEFLDYVDRDRQIGFLFVNDGSRDGTADMLDRLVDKAPDRFSAFSLERNMGKAEAVRLGILRALGSGSEFVGYWDADLATPLEAIPTFIETFVRKPTLEVVFGARVKLLGRDINRRAARHYAGRVFATAASLTLGLGVYDTQCGAKIFRATDRVRRAFADPFVSRWIFDVELLDRIVRDAGALNDASASELLYELPLLRWTDVAGSSLRGRDFIRAAFELLQIRMRRRPTTMR